MFRKARRDPSMEYGMEETPGKRPPAHLLTDVCELELNRLSILNEQLAQAEQWIDRRSHEMVAAYGLAERGLPRFSARAA